MQRHEAVTEDKMFNGKKCPQCGAKKTSTDPNVPCSACLMKLGMQSWEGGQSPTGAPMGGSDSMGLAYTQGVANVENPISLEELRQAFPQFEIIEVIGVGGMGVVYRANQKSLDRIVALKVIKPGPKHREDFANRFSREAKALARLSHPNIVTVHDFGNVDGLYYFVMEYVDGLNLRQLIQSKNLTARDALEIVPAVCDALQYAHDNGIVHRDIKPENILVDKQGRVKIADFGLAKMLDSKQQMLTQTNHVMGTAHYMAPEQVEKPLEVDHRADIYSLGVVIYELLTGELPIGRFAPPSRKAKIDVRLDEIVLQTLEKEPSLRYQRVNDIKTDMSSISAQNAHAFPPKQQNAPAYDANHYEPVEALPVRTPPAKPVEQPAYQCNTIPKVGFFEALFHYQTWSNALYMLLAFPLAIFYFVFLVTGLSTGLGTVVIWIGVPVLIGTLICIRGFALFERSIAAKMLNINIPIQRNRIQPSGIWEHMKFLVSDSLTWTTMVYIVLNFVLSTITFSLTLVALAVPLVLIVQVMFYHQEWFEIAITTSWKIDTVQEAGIAAGIGCFLLFVTPYVVNGCAWLHANLAWLLLGRSDKIREQFMNR